MAVDIRQRRRPSLTSVVAIRPDDPRRESPFPGSRPPATRGSCRTPPAHDARRSRVPRRRPPRLLLPEIRQRSPTEADRQPKLKWTARPVAGTPTAPTPRRWTSCQAGRWSASVVLAGAPQLEEGEEGAVEGPAPGPPTRRQHQQSPRRSGTHRPGSAKHPITQKSRRPRSPDTQQKPEIPFGSDPPPGDRRQHRRNEERRTVEGGTR